MPDQTTHFQNLPALLSHMQKIGKGSIVLPYLHVEGYPGMVLGLMIFYNIQENKYELDLQWMSFGLDLYGDTLQESYVYRFESLEKLLDYLREKYELSVSDILVEAKFDYKQFPDPIKDKDREAEFREAWERFQADFREGKFLEPDLELTFNSVED